MPWRGRGEEESEAALRRKRPFLFVRVRPQRAGPRVEARAGPGVRVARGVRVENGTRLHLGRGAGWCWPAGILPARAVVAAGRPSNGLSTAVSPWKCPPAWAPPGIPRSRCLPTAELCSTLRPNWLESEVPHFK